MTAQKKMVSLPSKLTLLSVYAIAATIALSHHFVRDVSQQLKQKSQNGDENLFYEEQFRPANQPHRNANLRFGATDVAAGAQQRSKFPIRTHIVTQGRPRTATTLLFNMVAVSNFLYLSENDPMKIPELKLHYWQREKAYKALRSTSPPYYIIKAHVSLDNFLSNNTAVFTAAADRQEAAEMRKDLERDGHDVAFIQDMETIKEDGVPGLVEEYVAGYGLSEKDKNNLNDYFSKWEILRQCCGQQMSVRYRSDLMPQQFKVKQHGTHPTCASHDIDSIEQAFMKTELFSLIDQHPNLQSLNWPSMNDGNLNGTYCSSYEYLVRTQGLSIWGQPGGRAVRSKIDGAIKKEIQMGTENLRADAHHLFPSSDRPLNYRYKAMWSRPEEEKKAWLRAVLAARLGGGKTYEEYGIEPTTAASADTGEEKVEGEVNSDGMSVEDSRIEPTTASADAGDENGDFGDVVEGEISSDDNMSVASADEQEPIDDTILKMNGHVQSNVEERDAGEDFDDTHAIFLVSFGEEAAESTLVERCILSLRRRGEWNGYIVLLTDAPPERYQNEWDDNVIVMHPLGQHLHAADGSKLTFTKDNLSLKPKRFKTYIIDYIDMNKRLDSVELIYYLDIDILAGNAMASFFGGIESKYEVSREERSTGLSKLYFFTPLSKEWPLQGGTFVIERRSSRHCLELWRTEIDGMTKSGRGRDQDGLRTIYQRIESGQESKCNLVRMENENFVSFPTPRTFDKLTSQSSYPDLIHISNSVFAKWIDEEAQTKYIHKVLKLSEGEEKSGRYGKAIVNVQKSDIKKRK